MSTKLWIGDRLFLVDEEVDKYLTKLLEINEQFQTEIKQLKKPFTVDELRYALMILNHPMTPEGITLVGKLQVLMLEAQKP